MNIYVGNLPFSASEDQVRELFEQHGQVDSVNLISDRESGRPRGFGFVEMGNDDEARKAMDALNEYEMEGRSLKVNEARKREELISGAETLWQLMRGRSYYALSRTSRLRRYTSTATDRTELAQQQLVNLADQMDETEVEM